MKKFFVLFVLVFSAPAWANITGLWKGAGYMMGDDIKSIQMCNADLIVLQSEKKLAFDKVNFTCQKFILDLKPFYLKIDGNKLFYMKKEVGYIGARGFAFEIPEWKISLRVRLFDKDSDHASVELVNNGDAGKEVLSGLLRNQL